MLEMNPEIRAQWCAALRSGEYTQARKALRKTSVDGTNSYCCLGVLTDLYLKAGNPEDYQEEGEAEIFYVWDDQMLPEPVIRWAGLDSDNPSLTDKEAYSASAASWNDDYSATFNEIADMIDG